MGQIQQGLARNIKSKPPSSTFIRMASRLPILLFLCLIPLLASALGEEEERSHEVQASSAELQASVVKREAKECKGKSCKRKKKNGKAKNGKKRKITRRSKARKRSLIGKNKDKGTQKQRKGKRTRIRTRTRRTNLKKGKS